MPSQRSWCERAIRSATPSTSELPSASTRAPSTACVLTTSNSSSASLPGLSRIESGIAILPEVVQRRGLADEPDEPVVLPDVARHPRGERADALRVLGRVVVAVLRREREPPQRVDADRLRVAERAQRLAGHDRLELAEAAAHRPVLEHAARAGARRRAPSGRPSAASSATGTTGGPASSPSGSSCTRTASGSVSPSARTTCGLRGRRLGGDEVERGHEIDRRAARRAELRAKALGCLAVPADNQDAGAGEGVVIHTAT